MSRLRALLRSAGLGLIVGFFWESFGALFLWTLASPFVLVFVLAMALWAFLGVVMAELLRLAEARAGTVAKTALKVLVATAALLFSGVFMQLGLISFRVVGPNVLGVPLYMMTGSLALVFLMDASGFYR